MDNYGRWVNPKRNTAAAGLVMLAFVMMAAPAAWTALLEVPSGAYPSLAAAAAACAAGDTINITSSYTDMGGSATVTGGTPVRSNVTIQGNGHTVTCGAVTWTGGVICFKNVTGGVVQNLTIDGAGVGPNLLFVDGTAGGGATSVTATDCTFTGSINNGIRVTNAGGSSGGATLMATRCRSHNNAGHGLAVQANAAATVSLCLLEDNAQAGIATPNAASTLAVRDTVIRNNSALANYGQVYYANTSVLTHEYDRCQIYGDSPVAVIYKTATAGAVNLTLINCIIRRAATAMVPPQVINLGTNTQTVTMAHCTLLGAVSGYLFQGSATTLNATDTIFDSSAAGSGARAGVLGSGVRPNIAWRAAGNTGFTGVPAGTINQNPNLLATGYLQAASLPALATSGSSMALDVDNTARPKPASTPRDIGAHEAVFTPTVTTWPTASALTYPQALSASTFTGGVYSPAGAFTFDSPATVPDAGTYDAAVTFAATNASFTTLPGTVQVTVNKAAATVTLGNLTPAYDGAPKAASATTDPAGLAVDFTYDGSPTPPTNADSYAVVGTVNDVNYQGTASGTLVIAQATATVTLGDLAPTYDGAPKSATATTSPAGLTVDFTYDGSPTPPTAAGSYTVVGTVNDTNYQGSASGNLVIAKAAVTVTLVNVAKLWDGGTAVTLEPENFSPQGLAAGESLVISQTVGVFDSPGIGVDIPVSAVLTGLIAEGPDTTLDNYTLPATADGLGTITDKLISVVVWPSASAIVFGQALSASTLLGGSATDPVSGNPVSGAFTFDNGAFVPAAAGSYNADVTFTPTDTVTYALRQTQLPVEVQKAAATVTLGSLGQTYNGAPKAASATTAPAGLTVDFTYDGSPTPPTDADSYALVGSVNDANYQGAASGTLVIAPAAITVTADAKTKSVGAPDPALTWQVTSGALAPSDSLTGALTRAAGETAGTYAILQGTLTAGPNYDLTYMGANLTITAGGAFAVLYTGPNPVVAWLTQRVEITVASVNNTGTVDYQWYRVSNKALDPITGEITPTLVIGRAAFADAGSYLCEASNQGDTVQSPEIVLIVEGAALPAAGGIGLAVTALAAALTGAGALRRRK